MSDRRQELERKKQKLALIREEKEKRRREKAKEAEEAAKSTDKPEKDLRTQTEELLESLGISANDSPISRLGSSPRSATPETRSSPLPDSQPSSAPQSGSWNSKKSTLSLVSVNQVNIPPKEKVIYNKQTQTASTTNQDREAHPLDYYVLTYADVPVEDDVEGSSLTSHDMDTPPLFTPSHHPLKGLPHEMVRSAHDAVIPGTEIIKEEKKKVRELSEEEKKQIMLKEDFHQFFDRASRIIERALCQDLDILVDYTGGGEEIDG